MEFQRNSRPTVLVTNDDGVQAPGLRALVMALHTANFARILVCAPDRERSAQSHAITLTRQLQCSERQMPGAAKAWAVDGTPADTVQLALSGSLFEDNIDICLSGINRGDNCGLHVIYSGTVGAAREASIKGIPAIALSLDDYTSTTMASYSTSAAFAAALTKSMLGLMPGTEDLLHDLIGAVLNVNFPSCKLAEVKGIQMTHQSGACVESGFREQGLAQRQPAADSSEASTDVQERIFQAHMSQMKMDMTPGSDTWAVSQRLVSVTPLTLRCDIPFGQEAAAAHHPNPQAAAAVAAIIKAAAAAMGVPAPAINNVVAAAL
ncbi:hypothetical protein WJX74_000566 [Apatococcus lobatus]|uniref:Survival protein SurE-like phosphatase/nucleotidase domain-containing protein n=1 Tax=Apatococcus lobatus TaxID=904363 RepID=A0AAW1RXY1_9CHLO